MATKSKELEWPLAHGVKTRQIEICYCRGTNLGHCRRPDLDFLELHAQVDRMNRQSMILGFCPTHLTQLRLTAILRICFTSYAPNSIAPKSWQILGARWNRPGFLSHLTLLSRICGLGWASGSCSSGPFSVAIVTTTSCDLPDQFLETKSFSSLHLLWQHS